MNKKLLCLWATTSLLTLSSQGSESWPQWRGVKRDGHTSTTSGWNGSEWKLTKLWEENFGRGNSSPILAKGNVYLFGFKNGKDSLYCIDPKTGKERWSQSYNAKEFSREITTRQKRFIGGPMATPTYDLETDLIYTYNCDGILRCWNAKAAGTLVWEKDIIRSYRPQATDEVFGEISCPLIDGDLLVLEVGAQKKGHLVAFNKRTGKQAWMSEEERPHGRSSGPIKFTLDEKTCYASFGYEGLVVIRADNQKTIGTFPWIASNGHYCATPLVVNGNQLLCTGQGKTKTTLLTASLEGLTPEWTSKVISKIVSPVLSNDGKQAFFCNGGQVKCLDIKNGNELWKAAQRIGKDTEGAMVVTAENKLIVWGGNTLALLEAGPEYKLLATHPNVLSKADYCYPHPCVAEEYILVKATNGNTVCFKK